MKKEKMQNDAKRLLLSLMALAGAVSLSSCQTTKDWSDAIWGGAKVAAGTVVGATPFVKDAASAFDKSMDEWGNEALESAEKALEKEKFEDVKNNREKYAPVAQALAKYCLKKVGRINSDKKEVAGDDITPPDPETMPHISEILNDKTSISRALTGSFLADRKNALEIFRINFLELSKIVSNDSMIQIMQGLCFSNKKCQVYPLFSLASENTGRRLVARKVAEMYGCSQWDNATIQTAEDRLNQIKHRVSQMQAAKSNLIQQ